MAGIEQVIVHSKSYLVRWIQVPEHNSISWSVQPQKKSINFGIFKHPGTKNSLVPTLSTTQETLDTSASIAPGTPSLDGNPPKRGSISRHDSVAVIDKLQGIGMKSVAWQGNCEADKVTMGRYDVGEGAGGMYGMVFDNTFSKQTGKNVTFVLLIHPTNAPPKSGHHLHYAQAIPTAGDGTVTPSVSFVDSTETLAADPHAHKGVIEDPRPESKGHGVETKGVQGSTFYTGVLSKKRRKRGQGYAKRFFSLDFTSSTLSYYQNRHSSALRGAVPLSLAAIGANEKSREFSVDSGAEVWHLKAGNNKDFEGWRKALEKASASGVVPTGLDPTTTSPSGVINRIPVNPVEEQEWAHIEQLVSKVAGTRDAVRGLVRDTDPSQVSSGFLSPIPVNDATLLSPPADDASNSYFPRVEDGDKNERRPFWKRKSSAVRPLSTMQRRVSTASNASASAPISPIGDLPQIARKTTRSASAPVVGGNAVHERCMALLQDLDSVVASFSALIAESKARRNPPMLRASASRASIDSTASQEFFDAEDAGSLLLNIRRSSEYEDGREKQIEDDVSEADSDASSDPGDDSALFSPTPKDRRSVMFPTMPQTLPPLPLPAVKRRDTVIPPKQPPPSIIGFLRKNAGKDLSTVTMPVTANEPTSLLQRLSEGLEYTHLLDSAAGANTAEDRLMYVAAFAISGFAYNRVKERALRKPFNPMLGETYELVREDLGYRFLAEKVSHHPVRAACQADSLTNGGWSFAQAASPVQKFWGKSVELNTEGRARVILHALNGGNGELYIWQQATCFLRNVIAGEKYIEPVQTMTVVHEASGARAIATFKTGGMFSGRSEEVNVQFFEGGTETPSSLTLTGKWTESLKRSDTGATIWKTGPLVADAPKVYGFTSFAAALNQVTSNEEGCLPPTDSRLRPDQRALEAGDIDKAEALKAKLEERQRSRRKVLEGHGQKWQPQFFEKVAGGEGAEEETWRLKEGNGYWDRRVQKDWHGIGEVFET